MSAEIAKLGNPFKGEVDKKELVQLGTKDVMGEDAVKTVVGIEDLGKKKYEEFQKSRIYEQKVSLDTPITKNKITIFRSSSVKGKSSKAETKELKMHIRLFSQMYIAAQVRGADLNEFFSHETLPYPPALSKSGDMRSGNKSLLVSCIKPLENVPTIPQVDGAVLEGSMIANMTNPKKNQNFLL